MQVVVSVPEMRSNPLNSYVKLLLLLEDQKHKPHACRGVIFVSGASRFVEHFSGQSNTMLEVKASQEPKTISES